MSLLLEEFKESEGFKDSFKKSQSPWRWVILPFGCFMVLGSYYCFELPAGLKIQLQEYTHTPDTDFELKFSLLYTLYSAPNIVLPVIGGYIVDKFGVGKSQLLFCIVSCVGQGLFCAGASLKSWPLMLTGRFIFGLGDVNFDLANTTMLSGWFSGGELAFALGLNMAVGMLGYALCILISPRIASAMGIQAALWIGLVLYLICAVLVLVSMSIEAKVVQENNMRRDMWIALSAFTSSGTFDEPEDNSIDTDKAKEYSTITSSIMDSSININRKKAKKIDVKEERNKAPKHRKTHQYQKIEDSISIGDGIETITQSQNNVKDSKSYFSIFTIPFLLIVALDCTGNAATVPFNNIASSILMERNYFIPQPQGCTLLNPNQCQSESNPPVNCSLSDNYQPPLPLNYSSSPEQIDCNLPEYNQGCTSHYCDVLLKGEEIASVIMSIPSIISIVSFPILGIAADYFGHRAVLSAVAGILMITVNFSLAFSSIQPVFPMMGQGLSYTLFITIVWPCVSLVVPPEHIGLAYGIMYAIDNFSGAFFPFCVAEIFTHSNNRYIPNVVLFFGVFGIAYFLLSVVLFFVDFCGNQILNKGLIALSKETSNSRNSAEKDYSELSPNSVHNILHPAVDTTSI